MMHAVNLLLFEFYARPHQTETLTFPLERVNKFLWNMSVKNYTFTLNMENNIDMVMVSFRIWAKGG